MSSRQSSLALLRRRYVEQGRSLPARIEAELRLDPRPGARAILAAIDKRRHEHRAEGQRLRRIMRYERELWARGLERVAGVDEAGMSPLAGPVAAAAVILPVDFRIEGIDDSKRLDAAERERLAQIIRQHAVAWSVAFAEHHEIDRINIYWAGLLAMRRAVEGLAVKPEHLLIDARKLDLPIEQQRIIKGDQKCVTIAAASILAKTSRDALMIELDRRYPGYGFAQHKGYPVRAHYAALARLGPCPVHRRSFVLIRQSPALGEQPSESDPPAQRDGV
jgi:ribonuclease HII